MTAEHLRTVETGIVGDIILAFDIIIIRRQARAPRLG